MDPRHMVTLINDYNQSPDRYSDEEAEAIAMMAKQLGSHFKKESKPIRKLAYGLAEGATFGLLPDNFKPTSRGETVYGESTIDNIAGGLGMLGGIATGVGGAFKAGKYLTTPIKGSGGAAVAQGVKGAKDFTPLQMGIGKVRDRLSQYPSYHAGRTKLQGASSRFASTPLAQAGSKQFNKAVKSLSENLLITEETARNILMGSGVGVGALALSE